MDINTTLILGGARSGKSSFGEKLALMSGLLPLYIATAEGRDGEMKDRIHLHQQQREKSWQTIEEPLNLTSIIEQESRPERVVFIDCLTLWLSNLLEKNMDIVKETEELCQALVAAQGPIILISNEVGQGIVPANALARRFRDEAGRLNQTIAAAVPDVSFIIAGLCLPLKRNGKTVDHHSEG